MSEWRIIVGEFWGVVAIYSKSDDAVSPELALEVLKIHKLMENAWAIAKWYDAIGSFEGAAKIRRAWLNWLYEKDEFGNFRQNEGVRAKAREILMK